MVAAIIPPARPFRNGSGTGRIEQVSDDERLLGSLMKILAIGGSYDSLSFLFLFLY